PRYLPGLFSPTCSPAATFSTVRTDGDVCALTPGMTTAGALVAPLAFSSSAMRAFWASMVFCSCSIAVLSCLISSGVCARTPGMMSADTARAALKAQRRGRVILMFMLMAAVSWVVGSLRRSEDAQVELFGDEADGFL